MQTKPHCLVLAAYLLTAGAIPGVAQEEVAKVEVFGGYAYARADSSFGRVNLNGWSVSLERNLNRFAALAVDFDGVYGSHSDEDISAYSALFGAVREGEGSDVHYGIGVTLGGGLDFDAGRRLSLRLAQADYEYTRVNEENHHSFRFCRRRSSEVRRAQLKSRSSQGPLRVNVSRS